MTAPPAASAEASTTMASAQGATPPAWLARSRWRLLADVIGGWRQNADKLTQLLALIVALFRPSVVRRRLERLRALGHIDVLPTTAQLLVAGRDQMFAGAAEETKIFYRSQHIPWVFHNLRRFISGPATMLDPIGLFSSRDTIIHHVLQTFHRHPVYDLSLLRAHDGGVEAMSAEARRILEGTHPHQRALTSLIEDGSYHGRLPLEIDAFARDPLLPARPIPAGLVADPAMMLAMDQFKDVGGFARYAARLSVGPAAALGAWIAVVLHAVTGRSPPRLRVEACDPELVERHLSQGSRASKQRGDGGD